MTKALPDGARKIAKKGEGLSLRPEYRSWLNMKNRCYNPNTKSWKNYGGRGIAIAPEWLHDFQAFVDHVGPRPSQEHSIDRIDNDGDYCPGNVRWATASEQGRNRRPGPDVCKRGHSLKPDSDNLGFDAKGRRRCLTCKRALARRTAARKVRKPLTERQKEMRRATAKKRRESLQEASLVEAGRWGQKWTEAEVALASDTTLTDKEVAEQTQRTVYAVHMKRTYLRRPEVRWRQPGRKKPEAAK